VTDLRLAVMGHQYWEDAQPFFSGGIKMTALVDDNDEEEEGYEVLVSL
jgi:hypothetical protein